MRFRLGFVSGFTAGYYLGAKAGRQRYEEIQRTLDKVRSTEVFETTATKVKAVVDEGVDKAKTVVDEGVGKAKSLVDEGVEKAKTVVDRGSGIEGETSSPNGPATVPTAALDPSAAPDGAGPTAVVAEPPPPTPAEPAVKPADKPTT